MATCVWHNGKPLLAISCVSTKKQPSLSIARAGAQQSHYQDINIVQAIAQQLQLQQFGDLYFDRNLAQAQALLAFNVPSRYGIYPRYYSAPITITTLCGVWY
uniref:Uncharacterized protein n=1 Tax=Oryza nivara TaxID=4536 RepID=A0A0E0HCR9_ORYNI